MSGAQAKAAVICGAIGVVAEINEKPLRKRYEQGWVMELSTSLDDCIKRIKSARQEKKPLSLGFHGNIVELWERLAEEEELLIELGSDQTSLHNPFGGGYYPVQLSFDEANEMMYKNPAKFHDLVQESLRRHVAAVNKMSKKGMRFWDYGNSFLLEASRAKADIMKPDGLSFKYPSYFEDLMGDIFSLGFGPFRWVCTSGSEEDLDLTDKIAAQKIQELSVSAPKDTKAQYDDNYLWIVKAKENKLVVGSQARILYSDAKGRVEIAVAFNKAIAEGRIKGPVVLSRDHHDVSGTDSPFRETANITDGSRFCADMAVQNFVGDAIRGATWVALHNGGGVGWGEVMNGGFGLLLDGSPDAEARARATLYWDVNNGVARRAWSGNSYAESAIVLAMNENPNLKITIPQHADPSVIDSLFQSS
eukprot:TRINITY_DN758_c0_g1_i2.p1 TRINITY_DN758_c0_g1~~TRINITY_DN758_c0_g1_i2.p1  ORF type:complete len:419 (-),score=110.94 TRINITY_DN758_c0_g1_i2:355-1611(-)